jgi:hypothetical protein
MMKKPIKPVPEACMVLGIPMMIYELLDVAAQRDLNVIAAAKKLGFDIPFKISMPPR